MCDLAATGASPLPLLILAILAVMAGVALVLPHGRRRRGSTMLVTILLLGLGFGLAGPVSDARAAMACQTSAGGSSGGGGGAVPQATIAAAPVTFTAPGSQNLIVTNVSAVDAIDIVATLSTSIPGLSLGPGCAGILAPGASCLIPVTVTSSAVGFSTVATAQGSNTNAVAIGIDFAPWTVLASSASSLSIADGAQEIVDITNVGTIDAVITGIVITGDPSFTIVTNTCTAALAAGASCGIGVRFDVGTSGIGALELAGTNFSTLSIALTGAI
ncbi:MAG: hypothetical protein JWP19_1264 [Rhodoglobus sp.]|nr:hypothetical protein [Rhodoglobus sp.]